MKALVKTEKAPGLFLKDVPVPDLKSHEVLIKTKKTSICGTDVHIYKWDSWAQKTIPAPLVIGHEFMGEIAALGSDVKNLKVGMRVTGEGHITCGTCPQCKKGERHLCPNTLGVGVHRHGCFAEYFTLPEENVFPLPDSIPDDIAAIFDPFGNALHTANSFNLLGENVLITGAGPIGIMSAAIAAKAFAKHVVITDLNDYRLDLAKKLGAKTTLNIGKADIKSLGIKEGFGIGLEMSGATAGLNTLLKEVTNGGKIGLLGILPPDCLIDWDLVIFKMLTLKGIYGREIFSTWFKMVNLIETGLDLTPLITHHFSADEFQKGFDAMLSGNCGKVILNWDN